MRFIGILLAAGRGARFGGAKLLTPIPASSHGVAGGTTIGAAAAMHMVAALTDVVAVVRPGDTVLRHELEATGARVFVCDRADEGMGTSLAFAVGETLAVAPDADGFIVALADMPWIAPATILAVATALADGAEMVAPAYRGERGHPVGFARAYDTALKALTGDAGARAIIAARLWVLRVIEVDDPGVVLDVDQPDDLRS